jgi:hypothetical protein
MPRVAVLEQWEVWVLALEQRAPGRVGAPAGRVFGESISAQAARVLD